MDIPKEPREEAGLVVYTGCSLSPRPFVLDPYIQSKALLMHLCLPWEEGEGMGVPSSQWGETSRA